MKKALITILLIAAFFAVKAQDAGGYKVTAKDTFILKTDAFNSTTKIDDNDSTLVSLDYLDQRFDAIAEVSYCPVTMVVNAGTLNAGTVADLCDIGGTDVVVQEQVASPPIRITFTFSGVERLDHFTFYGQYDGGATHNLHAEAYNYQTASWDFIGDFSTSNGKVWYTFPLFVPNRYISSGAAQMRISHQGNGINTHQLILDYVDVNFGGGGGSQFITAASVEAVPNTNFPGTNVQEQLSQASDTVTELRLDINQNAADIFNLESSSHAPATVLDGTTINFSITGQQITGEVIPGAINHDLLFNYSAAEHFTQAAINITASQVTDFDTEVANNSAVQLNTAKTSFPGFSTLLADYGFTDNSGNWNTAYGWGDHSLAGYLTSYTETDPVYVASSWYTTTNNAANWNTAYSHSQIITGNPHNVLATQITDFDTEVANNSAVQLNTAKTSFPGFSTLLADYGFTDNSGNWDLAYSWGDHALAGYLTGTGTTNYLVKITGSNTVGNSLIYDNGSNIIINGTDNGVDKLQIYGSVFGKNRLTIETPSGNAPHIFLNQTAGADATFGVSNAFQDWAFGIDNTGSISGVDQSFVISNSTTLPTNQYLAITPAGDAYLYGGITATEATFSAGATVAHAPTTNNDVFRLIDATNASINFNVAGLSINSTNIFDIISDSLATMPFQTLSWNGGTGVLSITNGNSVDLDGRWLSLEGGILSAGLTVTGSLNVRDASTAFQTLKVGLTTTQALWQATSSATLFQSTNNPLTFSVNGGNVMVMSTTQDVTLSAYSGTNKIGTPTYLMGTDVNGKLVKTPFVTGITGSGVSGRLTYWNGTSSVTSDPDLTFNGSTLFTGGLNSAGQITAGSVITFSELASISTPAVGFGNIAAKTDGKLYYKNDSGTEYDLTGGGFWDSAQEGIQYTSANVGIGAAPVVGYDLKVGNDGIIATGIIYATSRLKSDTYLELKEISSISNSTTGYGSFWAGTTSKPYYTDDGFNVYDLSGATAQTVSSSSTSINANVSVVFITGGSISSYGSTYTGRKLILKNTTSSSVAVPSYSVKGAPASSTSIPAYDAITLLYNGSTWFQIN